MPQTYKDLEKTLLNFFSQLRSKPEKRSSFFELRNQLFVQVRADSNCDFTQFQPQTICFLWDCLANQELSEEGDLPLLKRLIVVSPSQLTEISPGDYKTLASFLATVLNAISKIILQQIATQFQQDLKDLVLLFFDHLKSSLTECWPDEITQILEASLIFKFKRFYPETELLKKVQMLIERANDSRMRPYLEQPNFIANLLDVLSKMQILKKRSQIFIQFIGALIENSLKVLQGKVKKQTFSLDDAFLCFVSLSTMWAVYLGGSYSGQYKAVMKLFFEKLQPKITEVSLNQDKPSLFVIAMMRISVLSIQWKNYRVVVEQNFQYFSKKDYCEFYVAYLKASLRNNDGSIFTQKFRQINVAEFTVEQLSFVLFQLSDLEKLSESLKEKHLPKLIDRLSQLKSSSSKSDIKRFCKFLGKFKVAPELFKQLKAREAQLRAGPGVFGDSNHVVSDSSTVPTASTSHLEPLRL